MTGQVMLGDGGLEDLVVSVGFILTIFCITLIISLPIVALYILVYFLW